MRQDDGTGAWCVASFMRFVIVFNAVFLPVYGLGQLWGARVADPWNLWFGWERSIPFVEWMIVPYLSLFVAYLVPLFTMDAGELRRLTQQSVIVTLIAGVTFIVLPAASGFDRPVVSDHLWALYALLHLIDRPHNLVPSLHVAGGTLLLLGAAETRPRLRAAMIAWLVAIMCSTVLIRQHHLIDVATGLALALIVRRTIPLRPATAVEPVPAGSPVPG